MSRRVPQDIRDGMKERSVASTHAATFWTEYAPVLEREGRLTDMDYASFEMLCRAYGALVACEQALARDGETILSYQERGDNQRLVKHPAAAARNENSRRFLDLSDRFGLNPKARGMLRPTEPKAAAGKGSSLLD